MFEAADRNTPSQLCSRIAVRSRSRWIIKCERVGAEDEGFGSGHRPQSLGLLAAVALAAGLWVLPPRAFPNPGANDAIVLADLSLPLVGAMLLASIVALIGGYRRRWSSAGPVALGTLLIGVAAALVIGLVTFGNMSNDRFLALLFLPVLFVPFGIVVLAVGLTVRSTGNARQGLVIGGLATAVLIAWVLGTRSPRLVVRRPTASTSSYLSPSSRPWFTSRARPCDGHSVSLGCSTTRLGLMNQ